MSRPFQILFIVTLLVGTSSASHGQGNIFSDIFDRVVGKEADDETYIDNAMEEALANPERNVSWRNPENGNSGTVEVGSSYQNQDALDCRKYTRQTKANNLVRIFEGAACKTIFGWIKEEENLIASKPILPDPPPQAQATAKPDTTIAAKPKPDPVVRQVQKHLTDLGYKPGPVDGFYGRKTQSAIEEYQHAKSMRVDGQSSTELLKQLKSDAALAQTRQLQKPPAARPSSSTDAANLEQKPLVQPTTQKHVEAASLPTTSIPPPSPPAEERDSSDSMAARRPAPAKYEPRPPASLPSQNSTAASLPGQLAAKQEASLGRLRSENACEKCDLHDVDLSKVKLNKARLRGANLNGANLSEAKLVRADLSSATLRNANLHGARLWKARLAAADLSNADLSNSEPVAAELSDANLSGASLRDADMREATASRANLRNADLRGVSFKRADLSGADLSGAKLNGADFTGANLSDARLTDANIGAAILCRTKTDDGEKNGGC